MKLRLGARGSALSLAQAGLVARSLNSWADVEIVTTPTDDHRSYHISSEKIRRELGFVPKRTVENAIDDLLGAFRGGQIPDAMTDIRYYNIRTMQKLRLT